MRSLSISILVLLLFSMVLKGQSTVEKWGVFEITLKGPKKGNPFMEITFSTKFFKDLDTVEVPGFYDGKGIYKIRFMPQKEGVWQYVTSSNTKKLHNQKGIFQCIPPSTGNHGPIVVKDTFHFSYADGKPFHPLGTTAYGWVQQNASTRKQTLESLRDSPFNKVRVALLPHAPSGKDLDVYPYMGTPGNWDFTTFNPEYFTRYEKYIQELHKLGIQLDLFLFHPYDKGVWGFDKMNKEEQLLYLNYVNARFGAFQNLWWSMANEFDLMADRTTEDWDTYFRFFLQNDPYNHLRSIHNAGKWYDHGKPWVTHLSAQSESWWISKELRNRYKKPVIFDEFCYEGNGDNRTVSLNGNTIRHRFWMMTVLGAYATHGEAFFQENTAYQFFRQGGTLLGNSAQELHHLKNVLDQIPGPLKPMGTDWRLNWIRSGTLDEAYFLYYLGEYQNSEWIFTELPEHLLYRLEILNTVNGTSTKVKVPVQRGDKITLPGKPYTAMILRAQNP